MLGAAPRSELVGVDAVRQVVGVERIGVALAHLDRTLDADAVALLPVAFADERSAAVARVCDVALLTDLTQARDTHVTT